MKDTTLEIGKWAIQEVGDEIALTFAGDGKYLQSNVTITDWDKNDIDQVVELLSLYSSVFSAE